MSAAALDAVDIVTVADVEALLAQAGQPRAGFILAAIDISKVRDLALSEWIAVVDQQPARILGDRQVGGTLRIVAARDERTQALETMPAVLRGDRQDNERPAHARHGCRDIDPFLDIYAPIALQLVGL